MVQANTIRKIYEKWARRLSRLLPHSSGFAYSQFENRQPVTITAEVYLDQLGEPTNAQAYKSPCWGLGLEAVTA